MWSNSTSSNTKNNNRNRNPNRNSYGNNNSNSDSHFGVHSPSNAPNSQFRGLQSDNHSNNDNPYHFGVHSLSNSSNSQVRDFQRGLQSNNHSNNDNPFGEHSWSNTSNSQAQVQVQVRSNSNNHKRNNHRNNKSNPGNSFGVHSRSNTSNSQVLQRRNRNNHSNNNRNPDNPCGVHSWSSASQSQVRKFERRLQSNNRSNKCGVLLIGVTGSGKSTIVNIMTNNRRVKIGHSANSQTKEATIYDGRTYYWIDTKGTQDSDNNETSAQTLANMLKSCYDQGIQRIKVVWAINEDPLRRKPEFVNGAAFIYSLDTAKCDAFNSMIIIRKGGNCGDPTTGIQAAINQKDRRFTLNSSPYKRNYFGVKCIDQMCRPSDQDLKMYNMSKKMFKMTGDKEDDPRSCGYCTKAEYKELILGALETCAEINIVYEIEKCSNCSVIGDRRFSSAMRCHQRREYYHPQSFSWVHSGNSKNVHSGTYRVSIIPKDTIYDEINRESFFIQAPVYTIGAPVVHAVRLFQKDTQKVNRWSCCNNMNRHSSGCIQICSQCENGLGNRGCIKQCGLCSQDVDEQTGCKSQCSSCLQDWNTTQCTQ